MELVSPRCSGCLPVGCLPVEAPSADDCIAGLSGGGAEGYKMDLQALESRISLRTPDVNIEYVDMYSPGGGNDLRRSPDKVNLCNPR